MRIISVAYEAIPRRAFRGPAHDDQLAHADRAEAGSLPVPRLRSSALASGAETHGVGLYTISVTARYILWDSVTARYILWDCLGDEER